MKLFNYVVVVLLLILVGCSSQDTHITLRPEINCEPGRELLVETPANQGIRGGNVIYFEILVEADVQSKKDQTNTPNIEPTVPLDLGL